MKLYFAMAPDLSRERDAFAWRIGEWRPKLHRYCARMTGSAIDGEDVLQEAIVKALEGFEAAWPLDNPEGWLFRIAHNTALDYLRRQARRRGAQTDEDPDMVADTEEIPDREIAATSLHMFMRLPPSQRSSVILMDVLGYSLQEIHDVTELTVPAVKAALHRGRARLREIAAELDDRPQPMLPAVDRARLSRYVDRFNARDFDAVRDMLADDVRLDLVNRLRREGKTAVGNYFGNYDKIGGWELVPGLVDRRPAVLVRNPEMPNVRPLYFVLLEWTGEQVLNIRDFRYASYVAAEAEVIAFS